MSDIKKLYPVRACEFEPNEENPELVTVLYKNTKPSFVEKLFFKKQIEKPIKIDLDEIGSYIWSLCDGSKDVYSLIEMGREKFGEKIEPVEQRTEMFVSQLVKNKLAVLYKKNED